MRVAIVIHPFGDYGAGHRITDQAEIDALRAGERAHHVVITDHDVPGASATEAAPIIGEMKPGEENGAGAGGADAPVAS